MPEGRSRNMPDPPQRKPEDWMRRRRIEVKESRFSVGGLVAIGLLLFVAAPIIAGSLMTEDFRSEAEIDLGQASSTVWNTILDFRKLPVTDGGGVMDIAPGGTVAIWREGIPPQMVLVKTVDHKAPAGLAREIEYTERPIRKRWDYLVKDEGTGCRVKIIESVLIDGSSWRGPLLRVQYRLWPAAEPKAYLARLAARLGESAVPR